MSRRQLGVVLAVLVDALVIAALFAVVIVWAFYLGRVP